MLNDSDFRKSLCADSQLGLQANLSGPYFVDSNTSASELLASIINKKRDNQKVAPNSHGLHMILSPEKATSGKPGAYLTLM